VRVKQQKTMNKNCECKTEHDCDFACVSDKMMLPPSKIVRWIRSDLRLPILEKTLPFIDNVGMYRNGNFFKDDDGEIILEIHGNKLYDSYQVKQKDFHHYSWLDETVVKIPKS
jgi:hypothetical protein